MTKETILVIDDEKDIQNLLRYNLEKEGYRILLSKTGEEGLAAARAKKPDLVILDLMLPGMDGLEVCKILKQDRDVRKIPVLMLTAKGGETDQVIGLELGASDYLAKPFSVKVLLARVKNIFRSRRPADASSAAVCLGDFAIDRERHLFTVKRKPVTLTKLEFRILGFLMENPGKVFSRDQLLTGAWEGEAFVVDRTVDVHIRSLRQKLGRHRDAIETVRGLGYRFTEKPGRDD